MKRKQKNEPNKAKQNKNKKKENNGLFVDKKRCMGCPIFFSLGVHLDTSTSSDFGHPVSL